MTIPVVYSLARQYPELEVYYLTRPFFAQLFVNAPANLHMIEVDYHGQYKGVGGTLRLLNRLRKLKFDCVADLHDVLRSWIIDAAMTCMGKKVKRLKKDRSSRISLITHKQPQVPYIQRYADVFAELGFPVQIDFKGLYPKQPLGPDRLVGIAPFARFSTKVYPPSGMLELVRRLLAKGYRVYLFGSEGKEQDILEKWEQRAPGCISVAGKGTIVEELLLISGLEAMVTMDSANQHLASLVGTRAITIWGSTVPYGGSLGYGQSTDDAICLGLPCQPCTVTGTDFCPKKDTPCLKSIPVEVIEAKIAGGGLTSDTPTTTDTPTKRWGNGDEWVNAWEGEER